MRKGLSDHDALRKLIEDDTKSFIEGQIKSVLREGNNSASLKGPFEKYTKTMVAVEKKYNADVE